MLTGMAKFRRWVGRHAAELVVAAAFLGTAMSWWLYDLGSQAEVRPTADIPTAGLPRKGAADQNTKVVILECADFECPYSRRASKTVDELLERNDDVGFYFLHTPLRRFQHAMLKARAAVAAHRQGAFWLMHDALFDTRVDSEDAAIALADRLGLDAERFAADLADPAVRTEVERQRAACVEAGVTAVPTFFVNGRLVRGALPADELQKIIDDQRP